MVFIQKALYIDANNKSSKTKKIDAPEIMGPVDFGVREYEKDKSVFCFGTGILSGSIIPGTRRLVFTGLSPLWKNFYISTMGGAAYVFHRLGINYVSIKGKTPNLSVLEINRKKGKLSVSFHDISPDKIWEGYKKEIGVYALQQYIYDNYAKNFKDDCRILITGPASQRTNYGAIASAPIGRDGVISHVDCWAGRGGFGSKLLQDHNVVGIIYGGDFEEDKSSPLKDVKLIDSVFEEGMGKRMMAADMDATTKYRYDPSFKSGGTLGVNFSRLKSWMFSFNYGSVKFSEGQRLELWEEFIQNHYLKQFNEETIQTKQQKHCGEPCPAVCKKMNDKYKKDYEPYEALGPNMGVFDQRAAEKLNRFADAMGFDAIQIGSVISFVAEAINQALIPKEDLGLSITPNFSKENFDVLTDSMNNADFGVELIKKIVYDHECVSLRKGLRVAAKELDQKYPGVLNLAVYNAFGEDGCIVPNQYWVPGMFSPMPIMGKYFEYYGANYLPPRELGKKNVERMILELYSDNGGICRFHREWVEKLLEPLVKKVLKVDVAYRIKDYHSHHKRLAQLINLGNKPVFWETERVVDIIKAYLEKVYECEEEHKEEVRAWVEKFEADKWEAAKLYWEELKDGMNEAFSD
ncbi:aldehyde ferredoxin oxidoreductase [Candidatus Woesearchaeota archaeon]|nr:aldehyde ferredoxin oxidoreductase [Candidatus Woesearchaeota archaeon]